MRDEAIRQDDPVLRERVKELAKGRRRFGYPLADRRSPANADRRRLHLFLGREGFGLNHKRLFRIFREDQAHVRRGGGRKRAMGARAPMVLPLMPNQRALSVIAGNHLRGNRWWPAPRLQLKTPPCRPWPADARRVGPILPPATGPDAAQAAKLSASPRFSTRPNGQNSKPVSHSRWGKVGGSVTFHRQSYKKIYHLAAAIPRLQATMLHPNDGTVAMDRGRVAHRGRPIGGLGVFAVPVGHDGFEGR